MSNRVRASGLGRFVPVLVPVAPLMLLLTLHHPRVVYTSDSAAQQSIVRTWLDVGHGTTYLPQDTWALKIPLYLVLENLPLPPLDRMLAAVLVLNALTFLMLGWAAGRLAAGSAGVRWYEVTVPLVWLATLGGGIGSNRLLANYRNIELGLCFVMFAVIADHLAGPAPDRPRRDPRRLARAAGSALLLGILWFDDPYVQLLVAAPLAVTAVGWWRWRERDPRLLRLAAVLVASFLVTSALRVVAGWFGVELIHAGRTVAIAPADLWLHLRLLRPGTELLLGVGGWSGPAELITQVLLVMAFAVMLVGSGLLARYGWRQNRPVVAFLGAHWPLVVGGFMVSWYTQNASAGRYLVLAVVDVAVAMAVLLPELRLHRRALALALVGLIGVGAAFNLGTGAATAIEDARRPSATLPHQQDIVRAVERAVDEHGAVKGYAPFWSANITSYLVGRGTTAAELVCRDGRLSTRQWLSDTARLHRPAKAVFVIWDPQATYLSGCPAAVRDAQLGPPLAVYPIAPSTVPMPAAGVDAVLVYASDIQDRLAPGDPG